MATMTDVLAKLLDRTRAGKVPWKPTNHDDTFVAMVGQVSVVIDMDWRGIGSDMPTLRILDSNGRLVDWINVDTGDGSVHKRDLDELYQMARRDALVTGTELDDLLAALDLEQG